MPPGGCTVAQVVRPGAVQSICVGLPSRQTEIELPLQVLLLAARGCGIVQPVARGTHCAPLRALASQRRPMEAQSVGISTNLRLSPTCAALQRTAVSPSQWTPSVEHGAVSMQKASRLVAMQVAPVAQGSRTSPLPPPARGRHHTRTFPSQRTPPGVMHSFAPAGSTHTPFMQVWPTVAQSKILGR